MRSLAERVNLGWKMRRVLRISMVPARYTERTSRKGAKSAKKKDKERKKMRMKFPLFLFFFALFAPLREVLFVHAQDTRSPAKSITPGNVLAALGGGSVDALAGTLRGF